MKKEQGFTLPEMIAVIAILMFLALLSLPFVKQYIDDSYNAKAKIYMGQLREAHLNFERDFPGTTVKGTVDFTSIPECNIDSIYDETGAWAPNILVACKYIKASDDVLRRYKFTIGPNTENCSNAVDAVVTMVGLADSGAYRNKCSWMDAFGNMHDPQEQENEGESGEPESQAGRI